MDQRKQYEKETGNKVLQDTQNLGYYVKWLEDKLNKALYHLCPTCTEREE